MIVEILDMNKPTRATALGILMPNGGWWGESEGQFFCDEGLTLPTEEAIQAKLTELKAEYKAQAYARDRKAEYDALNQFELISDDANNGTTTHKDAVNAIKTKYPKP